MKITRCPPGDASGHVLDEIIYFLRCGFPERSARLLALAYGDKDYVLSISDRFWNALKAYTEKNYKK